MFLSQNPPRSSSPVNQEKLEIFTKDVPVGISRDFFQETGDSTRSLLAPIYNVEDDDGDVATVGKSSNSSSEIDNSSCKEKTLNDKRNKRKISETDEKENSGRDAVNSYKSSRSSSQKSQTFSKGRKIRSSATSIRRSKDASFKSTSRSSSSSSSSSSSPSSSESFSTSYSSSTKSNNLSKINRTQNTEVKGKTWDDWFIEKVISEIERIKLVKVKQKKILEERLKEADEKMKRDGQVEQNRTDWLQHKAFELEKTKREKMAQKEFEKLKERQEKELLDKKAKHKYEEWCLMKDEEKNKIRSKLKVEKKLRKEENELKQSKAEQAYKGWLRDNRKMYNNPGTNKFEIYENPKTHYTNPIPWVSSIDDDAIRKVKDDWTFCSPPLLWQDVAERRKRQNKQSLRKSSFQLN